MNHSGIDAHLEVHLLPKDQGGRTSSTPDRVWKCRLKLGQDFFDAKLVNRKDAPFEPGADARADVTFLRPDRLPKASSRLLSVELWELSKVGVGELVLKEEPAAAAS